MQIAPVTLGLATRSCRTAGFVLTEGAYAPLTSLSRHRHERATLSFAVSGSFVEATDDATLSCEELDLIAKPPPRLRNPPQYSRAFSAAEDFVRRNWQESLSVAQVAEAAGVHPATLVRLFRAHRNCSPGEYLRRLRVSYAARELARSARSIAEIAVDAGFYNQSHFTNAFKRQAGVTPAQYRRESGN